VCSVVLDAAYVFVCHSIPDAAVNALTGILVGEILLKIMVSSLVYLLVVAVPLLAVTASVPTTATASSRLSTVVIGRATAAMCARSWRSPTLMGLVGSDLRVGDGLGPSKKICCLPHGGAQMCPYTYPNTLIFGRV